MTKGKPCTLCNIKTEWPYFQELLEIVQESRRTTLDNSIPLKIDDDITCAAERFNHVVQQAAWSTTSTSSNSEINIEYSPAIKEKLAEKKKPWQTNKCPVLKNKLNRVIKALRNLLDMEKNQGIQKYLSNHILSATSNTNYSLWKAAKRLKRP